MKIDIVVKSFKRDLHNLHFLLKSTLKYLTDFDKFYILLEDDIECREFSELYKESIFVFIFVEKNNDNGYIYQQFIKLNGLKFSDADYLLPLDSDMIIFRKSSCLDWFYNGKPFINYGTWSVSKDFPSTDFIAKVLLDREDRTHDLRLISKHIVDNKEKFGVEIVEDNNLSLKYCLGNEIFVIEKNKLHNTWILSIQHLVSNIIDTMRTHYIFERNCIEYVQKVIEYKTKKSFYEGMVDINFFPVMSEYEVFGNLIYENKKYKEIYNFYSDSDQAAIDASDQLPFIKCNSRIPSAMPIYQEILDGSLCHLMLRSKALEVVRYARKDSPSELWG